MSRTVDPDQKTAMIAMAKAGHNSREISAAFGYTNKRSAGVALRRWGVTLALSTKARDDKRRAEISGIKAPKKPAKVKMRAASVGAIDIYKANERRKMLANGAAR
jgi:hypothetical protein